MAYDSSTITIDLPQSEAKLLDDFSRAERKSKDQVIREAIRRYRFDRQLSKMRLFGAQVAKKRGITSWEAVERIAG